MFTSYRPNNIVYILLVLLAPFCVVSVVVMATAANIDAAVLGVVSTMLRIDNDDHGINGKE